MNRADLEIAYKEYRRLGKIIPLAQLSWETNLDNYEPTRKTASGLAIAYRTHDWEYGITIFDVGASLREAETATYIIDDGRAIKVCYVAGYPSFSPPEGYYLHLREFPTSTNKPLTFDSWRRGPTKAYHLKIKVLTSQ